MVKIRIDGDTAAFEKKLGDLGSIGDKALNGLKVAAVAVGTALVGLGTYSLNVGKDFERGMSGVQAVLGVSKSEMKGLTELAKEMGATTVYSATEAAEALQFIAQAGYDAAGAAELLPDVLNLAATDAMALGQAAQYVTNGLAVFGDNVESATYYTDLLAVTAQKADGGVSDMAEAFMVAGGQAMLSGLNMTELATSVGILANNGIKGSEGGTHLRNVLKNLYTPTSDAAKAMDELNIQTVNADGSLVDIQTVLQQFQGKLKQLDDAARVDYMGRIFDTRTVASANALINQSGEEFSKLAAELENVEGAAAKMAETMLDNLEGDITILKSAFEGLGISIYEAFGDTARDAVQGLQLSVTKLNTEMKKPDVRKAIESIATAFASLIKTIGNMVAAVLPPLIKALGLVADNLDFILPVTLGLVAAFKLFSIINTVTAALKSMSTATAAAQILMNASTKGVTAEVAAQSMLTAALGKKATAKAIEMTATAAGMAVDKTNNIITKEGVAVSAAETAAVLINSGAISAKTVLLGVLNGSIKLTTALTWLWNAALQANMLGLVVAGVVALVGVLVGLTIAFGKQSQELRQLKSDTKDAVDASNQLQTSMSNSAAKFSESTSEIETSAGAAQLMANRLYDLAQHYHGSATEMAKMQILVEQLNEAVPGLNLQINKQTGQLNMNRAAVDKLISSQKEQLISQAKLARATELTEELIKQEENLRDLNNQLQEWKDKLASGEITEHNFTVATKDLRNEISELEADIKVTNEKINEYTEESAEAIIASEENAAAVAYSEESLQSLADQYGTTVDAIRAATDGTVESLDRWISEQDAAAIAVAEATATMAEEVSDSLNRIADAYQTSNDKIDLSNATSLQSRIDNITENQRLSDEYATNIAYLGERVGAELDDGLLTELQRGDAEAMALAQQMVKSLEAGDGKWAELNEYYKKNADGALTTIAENWTFSGESPATTMINELVADVVAGEDAVNAAASSAGTGAVESLTTSMTSGDAQTAGSIMIDQGASGVSGNASLQDASHASGQEAITSLGDAIDSGDPVGVGEAMINDTTTGVSNATPEFISTTETSATDAVEAAKEAASEDVTQPIGVALITGITNGVTETQAALIFAAETAANDAVSAARSAGSSSVTYSIGTDMMSGIENGINAGRSGVINAAKAAVEAAVAAAKAAAQISSPSKVMRREVGEMMGEGLALGIEDSTEDAVQAAEQQMQDVIDAYEDTDNLTLQARFLAEFGEVPARFFEAGQIAGEQFVTGFNLAAVGFMAMLENIMIGRPLMSVGANEKTRTVAGDVNINFNQQVNSPDAYARSVKNVFQYGLAGERT